MLEWLEALLQESFCFIFIGDRLVLESWKYSASYLKAELPPHPSNIPYVQWLIGLLFWVGGVFAVWYICVQAVPLPGWTFLSNSILEKNMFKQCSSLSNCLKEQVWPPVGNKCLERSWKNKSEVFQTSLSHEIISIGGTFFFIRSLNFSSSSHLQSSTNHPPKTNTYWWGITFSKIIQTKWFFTSLVSASWYEVQIKTSCTYFFKCPMSITKIFNHWWTTLMKKDTTSP